MRKYDLKELAQNISAAIEVGKSAAALSKDDGGSANMDCVVIYGLRGIHHTSMQNAGIDCFKRRAGTFFLSAPFDGQGNRRYAGVQAMYQSLAASGVDCYVHYQMD